MALCCRQLGISLHTLDSALPLYDALTGQRIGEELDRWGISIISCWLVCICMQAQPSRNNACLHRQCMQHCMARKLWLTLIATLRMLNTLAVLLAWDLHRGCQLRLTRSRWQLLLSPARCYRENEVNGSAGHPVEDRDPLLAGSWSW